jgi:hypothetical protein
MPLSHMGTGTASRVRRLLVIRSHQCCLAREKHGEIELERVVKAGFSGLSNIPSPPSVSNKLELGNFPRLGRMGILGKLPKSVEGCRNTAAIDIIVQKTP